MAKSPLAPRPAARPQVPENDADIAALFDEIDQEVKAKQIKNFFDRHGKSVIAVLLAVILGTAVASTWSGWQRQEQEQDSVKLIDLLNRDAVGLPEDELKQVLKTYAELGDKGAGVGHRMLARFAEAGTLLQNGQRDAAIDILKEIQKDTTFRPMYRDYALLTEVRARMDKDEPQALLDALKPLLEPKNAWYLSALEDSAVLYAKMGKMDDAISQLQGIVATEDAPLAAKERANQLMRLYTAK